MLLFCLGPGEKNSMSAALLLINLLLVVPQRTKFVFQKVSNHWFPTQIKQAVKRRNLCRSDRRLIPVDYAQVPLLGSW
jgi:hypothetical protein